MMIWFLAAAAGICISCHLFNLIAFGGHHTSRTAYSEILIDVTEYGVPDDGKQDGTLEMQHIFDTVVASKRKKGKFNPFNDAMHESVVVVLIPFGSVVITGPLTIKTSNLILQVDGRLQAWDITNKHTLLNGTVWPYVQPLPTYGDSRDGHFYQYHPFLYITNVENFRITGRGTVDGFGQPWWDLFSSKNKTLLAGRPNLVRIINSSEIEIDSVTFQNSPFWTIHPVLSKSIYIHHVTINAPLYAPNVDGIDPE